MTKVLMSAENPTGHKLEDLLGLIQDDIKHKTAKIADSEDANAKRIVQMNKQCIGLLMQAEAIQRTTYVMLNEMAPDQGPSGRPRIGRD